MIRYHLLLFIRNLNRQKLFLAINLLGLTVSLVSTILIYLYVQHELTFDSGCVGVWVWVWVRGA